MLMRKKVSMILGLVLIAVVLFSLMLWGVMRSKNSTPKTTDPTAVKFTATRTNNTEMIANLKRQVTEMQIRLAKVKKTATETNTAETTDLQLEVTQKIPNPNPTIMQVIDQAGSGNDMILHMWTGRPAVIHELAANKNSGTKSASTASVPTKELMAKMAEIRQDIASIKLQLDERAEDLRTCKRVAMETHDDAINRQAERDQAWNERQITALKERLQEKIAELARISPTTSPSTTEEY